MPRQSRSSTHCAGAIVHVICRFVDYRFVLDDEGRRVYRRLLVRALRSTNWSLVSYALMSSHIHLAFLMGSGTLRQWIHGLNQRFAQWVNARRRRRGMRALGPVFAGRPTTKIVDPSRARLVIAYQHRNPLEAGIVDHVSDSDWTSHRAYVGVDDSIAPLDTALGLRLSGYDADVAGRAAFHAFVERTVVTVEDLVDAPLPEPTASWERPQQHGSHEVIQLSCAVSAQPFGEVTGDSRRRAVVAARRIALVAWLELGGPLATMARALNISPSAASHLLSRPHDTQSTRAMADVVLQKLRGTT